MQRLAVSWIISVLLLASSALPSTAQISGSSEPAFVNALELWLEGDDATSLPAMADLARDGNKASRLLLSQIELLPSTGSEFLDGLSKKDRRLLFRSDEGAFGKSWLNIEGRHDPFAQALLDWRYIDRRAGAIPVLLEYGEAQLASKAIMGLAQQGDGSLLRLANDIEIPASVSHHVWLEAVSIIWFSPERATGFENEYIDAANKALSADNPSTMIWYSYVKQIAQQIDDATEDEKMAIGLGFLLRGQEFSSDHNINPRSFDEFKRLLLEEGFYESIRQPCARLCPKEVMQCTRAAFNALGGHDTVVTLGTPLQSIIPNDEYLRSRRSDIQLIQFLRNSPASLYIHKIRNLSSCLADHIEN